MFLRCTYSSMYLISPSPWGGRKSFSSRRSRWAQPKHTQLLTAQMQIMSGQFLVCLHFLPKWGRFFLGCQIGALCPWLITLHLCFLCLPCFYFIFLTFSSLEVSTQHLKFQNRIPLSNASICMYSLKKLTSHLRLLLLLYLLSTWQNFRQPLLLKSN